MKLNHFNENGEAHMVDVGSKKVTGRMARAIGKVTMKPSTLRLILDQKAAKGDVLGVARLAGIMAAKKTADLIPLCHPVPIHAVDLSLLADEKSSSVNISAKVSANWVTGVEMEALTAVSVAGLTVYDMLKSVDREMIVSDIMLMEKTGGQSGHFLREDKKPSH